MVQINLLPDVKIKYIKARALKRMVTFGSLGISAVSIASVLLLAFTAYIGQGARIAGYNKDIKKAKDAITAQNKVVSIDKILTVQGQLNSLDKLHADKPIFSRTFTYLTKLVPSKVTLSELSVSTKDEKTINIQGTTDTVETVNTFIDTLKFAQFRANAAAEPISPFKEVVLLSFGRDKSGATYSISMKYDPLIFEGTSTADGLVVPRKTTTRSELERPVFQTEAEKALSAPVTEGNRQ